MEVWQARDCSSAGEQGSGKPPLLLGDYLNAFLKGYCEGIILR